MVAAPPRIPSPEPAAVPAGTRSTLRVQAVIITGPRGTPTSGASSASDDALANPVAGSKQLKALEHGSVLMGPVVLRCARYLANGMFPA